MQISASNLLAAQSQTTVRRQAPAPAFEPIAFKEAPAASVVQDTAKKAAPTPAANVDFTPPTSPATGYTRPGTHIDIKI
ncbi:hypothetical protein [Rhizomicrobium electricum]|uniref:Uncharacterized protein n=1 Tax=Rhizomicrobium electricum TaxID=480070 RepID=A0ABN1EX08_9PROT|nr:hypothetical protein [Rhizomicrobium electricum]NIJ49954.1 hypothetical protein [Rhizomicrobium electricum]